ncbi:MAG: hypothetical protein A3E57_02365 [Candidatus Muproteobacteria bacterium RIFCSPHIGHO2_12_FULL_60_33]|uniref:DUF1614 domain-containing protein n=1 Tax=Candidatus Muproteobacteria bacterium RIFCSPLOWO2_01_FULL_60_18 TaxID=1817768 RepID=A0A1F6U185_9PROT|nr:MAG: hypothetical protein A3A87_00625 [Candidatus Muproteobacteria bacterium RIFCSPLOWO2_01_FULL_60_18]OGI53053.1 MAG: hypothetical protein A2W42_03320 [Candidatus Muproteobacteria bacterium RIFCSPHIGHO2_01_60_12]OGI54124.1 MAG: hypothetical protein A3E57_02365 [Candidatus Muproteobacteria bacterium RIFCSPHIGHO2_12_FULL_60_33]OGI59702.1 MAG: hypothetical protein A2809_05885 [Candidatus Muproteobacteria bacterium RIFCSPHIGHO2_01_FULL_61_200]
MRLPYSPLPLLVFLFALGFLLAIVQIGALTIAFDKLGLTANFAFLLLFASLFGSAINLPLFTMTAERPPQPPVMPAPLRRLLRHRLREFKGKTLVAVNVGGCLIPLAFSIYLMTHQAVPGAQVLIATVAVALVSRLISRPIPGIGIGMPIFVPPLAAATLALLVNGDNSAALAYISGTLGVIIGADLLRLPDIRRLGTPFAAIGGAGTFDGIFVTGIVAVLLA